MFSVPKQNKVEVIFGYTDLSETHCPVCGHSIMAMENHNGVDKLHCWECTGIWVVNFDSDTEREAFISKYERKNDDGV